jgi:hypothetical protein
MDDGWRKVEAGACGAWPLPADATCAGVARRLFRRTASALALDGEAVDDGETIVSELAANTLHVKCGGHGNGTCGMDQAGARDSAHAGHHEGGYGSRGSEAHGGTRRGGPSHRGADASGAAWQAGDAAETSSPGNSELWLYLRGSGEQCELVCKVFDTYPGWAHGDAPGHGGRQAAADAMSGRGLEVVHELSHGHWGYHLTRSRLGGWNVRGKAVWFTTPAPFAKQASAAAGRVIPRQPPGSAAPGGGTAEAAILRPSGSVSTGGAALRQPPEHSGAFAIAGLPRAPAAQAMARLEESLVARGFGDTMVRADDPAKDTSVLAVCGELTVWCRTGCAWLRAPGMDGPAWGYGDLVEVAEQVVAAHETFCVDPDLAEGRTRIRA